MGGSADAVTFNDYCQIYFQADTSVVNLNFDSFSGGSSSFIYNQTGIGFILNNRLNASGARFLLNGSLLSSIGAVSGTMVSPNFSYPLMAANDPSVGITHHAIGSYKDFVMGTGLTTTQETALYNALAITVPIYDTAYASPLMLLAC
jgi:hypothetical protein